MQWRVQCFAGLKEMIGQPELVVDLPEGATAADLKARVEYDHPVLKGRLGAVRVAAGYDFLSDFDPLPPRGEVALIPPVSGGAPGVDAAPADIGNPSPLVTLAPEPLSAGRARDLVAGPDAGAIVSFAGTVRGTSRGMNVLHLEYEAYRDMALERLGRIARNACAETGALRAAIHHRLGRVDVGEDSVVIAVAAAHRDEAFKACRAIIEALKADVPIWKKEFYEGGSTWVGWG